MQQRMDDQVPFTKNMWPGGDTSELFITFPSVPEGVNCKKRSTRSTKHGGKNIIRRHGIGIKSSGRKQRRISTYFSKAAPSSTQHDQVLEVLAGLSKQFGEFQRQFKSFRKQLRRRKRRSSCKLSSFQSLLPSCKTCNKTSNPSDKGCQTDPTWMVSDDARQTSNLVSTLHLTTHISCSFYASWFIIFW